MKTNADGLTFQQWMDTIDAELNEHFGITHEVLDRDWEYHWWYGDNPPAVEAWHVMSIEMPHTYAAHTNANHHSTGDSNAPTN